MDIISVDEILVPDASIHENVNESHGNEALEIQAGDEITLGHKLTGSQSSTDYDKSGDSKRRGTRSRSKTFLEEPSQSKAVLFMQRKPGGKGLRSTHGSHGDGICLWPSWDINKGFTSSEPKDKGTDQEKKLQIVFTDTATQAGGVTQKLFDSNVTFADLVRVYTTQENNAQNCKIQLGNTLLSTVHASTLVSNYLNTYRSYLDYLRKTCGRGDSHEQLSSPRAPSKSVPLFLPLAGMTSVFSDDSREDPEFLELLKKTTTESIRKLWPHSPTRGNIVCKAGLGDSDHTKEEEPVHVTESSQADAVNSDTYIDTSVQQFVDTAECDNIQFGNDGTLIGNSEHLKVYKYSYMCDNHVTVQEDSNVSTNNPNYAMKFSTDTVLVGDGDSASIQNMNSSHVQKGILKVSNDSQSSVDNLYKNTYEPLAQQNSKSGLSNWGELNQQKCASDTNLQMNRTSNLDTLLQQQQQKLAHQQQLQRQMLQHQQQLQQQQRQQQLIQQYQQQEQQRQQQPGQFSTSKSYGFQSCSDQPKSWVQTVGDSTGMTSYRACLGTTSQPSSSFKTEPVMSHQTGLDSFSNSYQVSNDYFASNNGQSHMGPQTSGFPETSSHARTLKASYACLDPSIPMTLSVDPLHAYSNESDVFMNQCDHSCYDRHPFSNIPSSFGPSFDDRGNCNESSRMWAKISRPVTSFNDNDNAGKCLEERLRKAYVRSRISQFSQQGQWNDSSRFSVQRPIVKMNTVQDSNEDGQSFAYQNQRAVTDSDGRRIPSSTANVQDRWNRLVSTDAYDNMGSDVLMQYPSGLRDDKGMGYTTLQSSAAVDHNSRMSRLFPWKEDTQTSNKVSYFPAPRSPGDISGFPTNDSAVHSLLSGLQLDRDFSWNASSISCQSSSVPVQSPLFQCGDQPGLGCDDGQCKLPDAGPNKLSALPAEQRRQYLSNNNNASVLLRCQCDQMSDCGLCYDVGDTKHNTWLNSRHEGHGDQTVPGTNNFRCGPVLSPSMQILNKKILAAQTSMNSQQQDGNGVSSPSDGESPKGKEQEKTRSGTSTPSSVDSQSTENLSKHRLNRSYSEASNNFQTNASTSISQISSMQSQQQTRQSVDNPLFKLSEDLEKTFLDDTLNSTPWHEMTSQDNLDNDFNEDNSGGEKDKYVKVHNFNVPSVTLSDQEAVALRASINSARDYEALQHSKEQRVQPSHQVPASQMSLNQQTHTTPRMILGANSVKQTNEDKVKAEVEESNRRLRQMLGLAPSKDQPTSVNVSGIRLQDNCQMPPQTPSPGLMTLGQTSVQYNQNSSPIASGQMPRMHVTGGKIQAPVGITQQMYCVPNILMPPPSVQSQNSSRQSNIFPIQGVVTGVGSGSRFPQGMIRVPFVDMSRLVYVHQVPVSVSSAHPNNNHNNSSSSNPHVNTSNIITINTSDNDFSVGGQGDKCGRHVRANPGKKTTFLKMRSGSEEFAVPILGIRPPLDDSMCPRLVKSRTNPWDQDLDHDFSNSVMSKTVSVENISGACVSSPITDPNFCNPEVGFLYPDVTNLHAGSQAGAEQAPKTATFMQWPASADIHPEMLDMLPMRRAMPEDCSSGRLCWPEMEFLMSSREQLQTARRSNKPMGSNKANLISIIPKENAVEGLGGLKDMRFEKPDKLA